MSNAFPKLVDEVRLATATYSLAAEIVGGDELVSADVSAEPDGLTLGSPVVDVESSAVTFLVSGGELGTTYKITCLASTVAGAVIGAQVQVYIIQ